ncbi:MAG: MFS transporter [Minisyncoccia bacterium]
MAALDGFDGLTVNKRWVALFVLCLGVLMIVLDTTIVNVALPSIKADLGFTDTSLVWVINAYMLAFSGFMLLGGRLGDLYGQRRVFLVGLSIFTLASLACGVAQSQFFLIAARAVQGFGGAIVNAVALSIILNLFTENADRAKAMGFFGFVAAGGGAIGVLLGGILTGSFDWHWNFLVNIPIGITVFALCMWLLPKNEGMHVKLDLWGAITVTGALMLAVYAVVNGNAAGWFSLQTLGLLGGAAALFAAFLYIERTVASPLVPLSIFKPGNIATASIIGILWSAAMFSWFFLLALYLQLILGYKPLQVGLSFLPGNLIMMAFSLGLSAWVVMRFGTKKPLALGMALIALGLISFGLAPENGSFLLNVFPGMLLLGVGAGLAFNPVLLSATDGIPQDESGLASGVLNTAFMMGGSLGLAVLASLAAWRTGSLLQGGTEQLAALLSGYHIAFFVGAVFAIFAALLTLRLKTTDSQTPITLH